MRQVTLLLNILSYLQAVSTAPLLQPDRSIEHYISSYLKSSSAHSTTVRLADSQIRNELQLPCMVNYAQPAYCEAVNSKSWTCGPSCWYPSLLGRWRLAQSAIR